MIEKRIIKNPGCELCRYFLPPFKHQDTLTPEACLKEARKIYQSKQIQRRKRNWKWSDCSYSKEKNKDRLCKDYKIPSLTHQLFNQLILFIKGAEQQQPPTFSREIWWET